MSPKKELLGFSFQFNKQGPMLAGGWNHFQRAGMLLGGLPTPVLLHPGPEKASPSVLPPVDRQVNTTLGFWNLHAADALED